MQRIILRRGRKDDARKRIDVHRLAIHEIAKCDYSQEILNSWGGILTEEELNKCEEKYNARIEKDEDIIVVAEISGRLVGFGDIVPQTNEITAMYVDPDFKRQGVATSILEYLESIARESLEYLQLSSSLTAVPFYRKNGFIVEREGTHTLSTGVKMACVIMKKNITEIIIAR